MTLHEAVALLRQHNEWRRGADINEQIDPSRLGEAIDLVCDFSSRLPPEIDRGSRVLDGLRHSPNFASGWNRCRAVMLGQISKQGAKA